MIFTTLFSYLFSSKRFANHFAWKLLKSFELFKYYLKYGKHKKKKKKKKQYQNNIQKTNVSREMSSEKTMQINKNLLPIKNIFQIGLRHFLLLFIFLL